MHTDRLVARPFLDIVKFLPNQGTYPDSSIMAKLQPLKALLPTVVFSLIYGALGLIMMIALLVKKGTKRFFHVKERRGRPAVLDDPSLGKHGIVQLESVKLHYVAHGDPGKPLMLFLHGFPECWFSWRHQIRHFAANYRTVAVDMRGYGESDKPASVADYVIDDLIEDIHQLIPALGYERCVLVSHDWGGSVAGHFTGTYPDMVEKLVLINVPHVAAFLRHLGRSWGQLRKSWYMFMFQWPLLAEWIIKADDFAALDKTFMEKSEGGARAACTVDELEAYKYSLGQPGGLTGPINYYRAGFRYQRRNPIMDITKVPSHMIWGEQDFALEKAMAELSKEHISGLGVTYIPTAGHWSLMEEYEQVNRAIDNFLSMENAE